MKDKIVLKANKRTKSGTSENKRLRHEGKVPAVIYGKNITSIAIIVNEDEVKRLVKKFGRNAIINIEVEGETYSTMIKDIRFVHLKANLEHIDFLHVSMTEEVRAEVSIRLEGRDTLVAKHLVLIRQLDNLKVKGLPQNIPDAIEVDVSLLEAGSTVTVGDLNMPEGITSEEDLDILVLSVNEFKAEVEEVEEEDEEGEDTEEVEEEEETVEE